MVENPLLKWLLLPLSLLFGLGVAAKNALYRAGLLTSVRFSVPVITVGNLTVGGTGKTPHVEYLIRLLRPYLHTAVMSRGYGRHTSGFLFVRPEELSTAVGDESLTYARKYRDVVVAVSESRSIGIPMLLQQRPDTQVILLDDAFQHRSVTPSVNILLTECAYPFYDDWLLPVGRLREWRGAYKRADILIVTKCPLTFSETAREEMIRRIDPLPHQSVFFSALRYHHPYRMYPPQAQHVLSGFGAVLIVAGIARPDPLLNYVAGQVGVVDILLFDDHHDYSEADLTLIERRFQNLTGERKMILTTEKDAVRLEVFGAFIVGHGLPVFVLPVEVVFPFGDGRRFEETIRQFLLDFKV